MRAGIAIGFTSLSLGMIGACATSTARDAGGTERAVANAGVTSPADCDARTQRMAAQGRGVTEAWPDRGVAPRDVEEVLGVPYKVDALLKGSTVEPPAGIRARIMRESNVALFDPKNATLIVPVQLTWGDGSTGPVQRKHPKFTLPVIAHEYGHAIFGWNTKVDGCPALVTMGFHAQSLSEIQERVKTLLDELAKLTGDPDLARELVETHLARTDVSAAAYLNKPVIERIDEAWRAVVSRAETSRASVAVALKPAEDKRIGVILEWLRKLQADGESHMNQMIALASATRAVNELFADVVAYLYTGDPDAVRDALGFARRYQSGDKHASLRSFRARPQATIPNLLGAGSRRLDSILVKDVSDYEVLNPVRARLWDRHLSRPGAKRSPVLVLSKIAAVFQAEVDAALRDVGAYESQTYLALNARVNEALDRALADLPR